MLVWGSGAVAKVFIIVFGATVAAVILHGKKFRFETALLNREVLLLLWFYFALIVSILLSSYKIDGQYMYANEIFKASFLGFLIILLIDSKENINLFENVLMLCIAFLGIWAIEQHFLGNVRLEGLGGSAYPDSNGVAAIFVLYIPLSLRLLFDIDSIRFKKINLDGIKLRIIGLTLFCISFFTIIFTQSRGGLLGLLITFSYYTIKSRSKLKIFINIIISCSLLFPFVPQETLDRYATMKKFSGTSELDELDYSGGSRIILTLAGLKIFRDNPLFGTGFLSFNYAKMKYKSEFDNSDLVDYAFVVGRVGHNTYVKVLSEGGLFAAIPFFLLIFGIFFKNESLRRKVQWSKKNKDMFSLLSSIEAGIIGHLACIFFIDAVTAILLYIQIFVSSAIRKTILAYQQNENINFHA